MARLMASASAILNPDMPDDDTTYALLVQDLLLAKRELRLTELELGFVLFDEKTMPPDGAFAQMVPSRATRIAAENPPG
jgi:hypothetical protein